MLAFDIPARPSIGCQPVNARPVTGFVLPSVRSTERTIQSLMTQPVESQSFMATQILTDQKGQGVFDVLKSVLKATDKIRAGVEIAKAVGSLAAGPLGAKVSNVLSEKFNKNPAARPIFPGEKHLVLPTKHGLTRANYAGPGTNLSARLARGDTGVDGPRGIDAASRIHDIAYSLARNPADIRRADDVLINAIGESSQGPKTKSISMTLLRGKKFGEDVGVFGPETFTKLKGLKKGKGLNIAGSGLSIAGGALNPSGGALNPSGGRVDLAALPADKLKKLLLRDIKRKRRAAAKKKLQSGGNPLLLAGLAADILGPLVFKGVKRLIKKIKKKKKKK